MYIYLYTCIIHSIYTYSFDSLNSKAPILTFHHCDVIHLRNTRKYANHRTAHCLFNIRKQKLPKGLIGPLRILKIAYESSFCHILCTY